MLLSIANILDNAPNYGNAKINETWPKPQGTKMNRVKEKEKEIKTMDDVLSTLRKLK